MATTVMKIAVIGVGMVGGPLSEMWARAGHQVFISSRHPEELVAPKNGHKGSVLEAVQFADVILLAIPFGATRKLDDEVKAKMRGKVVIDANNAWERRDGPDAIEAKSTGFGTGLWTASIIPEARVVKAFNTWPFFRMRIRPGEPNQPAVPVAADDEEAGRIGMQLVHDAGLEGILLPGGLAAAARFDTGTDIGPNSELTRSEILQRLGLTDNSDL